MEIYSVTQTDAIRLDRFLLMQLPALRPGQLHKYLRENKIKVNGKKLSLNTLLQTGDEVRVYLPPASSHVENAISPSPAQFLRVVYEDDALLIADKPAGLPTEGEKGDTLIARVLRHLTENGFYHPGDNFVPSLCHRLDTGTCGLVIVAKTEKALQQCTELIGARALEKRYLCVTLGAPATKAATLRAYLIKDSARAHVRIVQSPGAGAKPIVTQYRTLGTSGTLALLEVTLVTGRTHQIRAHLASIGHPILGDSKYGDNAANRKYKTKYQLLCASRLTFPSIPDGPCHSVSQRTFTAETPWFYEQMLEGGLR